MINNGCIKYSQRKTQYLFKTYRLQQTPPGKQEQKSKYKTYIFHICDFF